MTNHDSTIADDAVTIRQYRPEDCAGTAELFADTVRRVNIRDYSPEQVAVWAAACADVGAWSSRLQAQLSFVAESSDGTLLGFISTEPDGHIDLLYCHADHQRRGIGSSLLSHVEKLARASGIHRIYTEASITARPFFEKHGFVVLKEQKVNRCGVEFVNYRMEKRRRS